MFFRHLTNWLSHGFGGFAATQFPYPLQYIINRIYVGIFSINLEEFSPPESYPSLNALFTRRLIQKRVIPESGNKVVSPADSFISCMGRLEEDTLLQIKQRPYSCRDLLTGMASHAQMMRNGDYLTFYLSPRDYHHFHAPLDMKIIRCIHVPGQLYPVNAIFARNRRNLFIRNERVILECQHGSHYFYLIMVGAFNVGSITLTFEPRLVTNSEQRTPYFFDYQNQLVTRGERLGGFNMGSTVVLITPPGLMQVTATEDRFIKYGDTIAHTL